MAVSSIQRQARALGDPTRYSLFRYIVDAGQPVTVAELTDYAELNHNAVRQHLAALRDAGLVVEEVEERDRPGRPRLLYSLNPELAGSWGTRGPYEWLARLLSEAVREKRSPRQVGRDEGRVAAAELGGHGDAVEQMESEMTRRGFRPRRIDRQRRVEFVLGRCPFVEVASADPDTVCALHLGMAEGMAGALGGLRTERLVAKNPRRAGCRLVLERKRLPARRSRS
jgi:predicted ArsR family transcriptional regulator